MTTHNPIVTILDLPDEILLLIFKKLHNIDLLYSLLGINQKLDKVVCDINFTQAIDLTSLSSNDTNDSRTNAIVDRFYTYILPRLHNIVESLTVEALFLQRVLQAKYYPNLYKLNLVSLTLNMASRIFKKNSSFIHTFNHQLSHLVVTISGNILKNSMGLIAQTYVAIFTWFSNVQYLELDVDGGEIFSRRLLRGLSPSRCYSSRLTHLRIKLYSFDDCLCLLDGRLSELHTLIVTFDYIRNSKILVNNEDNLLKLKCFSLNVRYRTMEFDNKLVPLLRRMSNIETLALSFRVRGRTSFIDGIYLTNEVLNYMSHLHTFVFDIVSNEIIINHESSPDDIRRAFRRGGYLVDCSIDYLSSEIGRCHVYSLPFTMERIYDISSRFSGGTFTNVYVLYVRDIFRSFEHTFFAKISRSFPLLRQLTVSNPKERLEKPSWRLKKPKEASSIIEYSHLVELRYFDAHIDYVEQFLCSLHTQLSCLSKLHVRYEHLINVTNNFTRHSTRINCAKLKHIIFDEDIDSKLPRDFYLYFPSLV